MDEMEGQIRFVRYFFRAIDGWWRVSAAVYFQLAADGIYEGEALAMVEVPMLEAEPDDSAEWTSPLWV